LRRLGKFALAAILPLSPGVPGAARAGAHEDGAAALRRGDDETAVARFREAT